MPNSPSAASEWSHLAYLGEQLRSQDSLCAQRDCLLSMTASLLPGTVEVWLNEKVFRLPDWGQERIFPLQPPLSGMKRAIKAGKLLAYFTKNSSPVASPLHQAVAVVPLADHQLTLGAIQVMRPGSPPFSPAELNLLHGIAAITSVSLYASHRAEVEKFRLRQLNLVREVSAQIANVPDLDLLSKSVTRLIQAAFHYYYVAIYTVEPGSSQLRFRSSVAAPRKGRPRSPIMPEVHLGQGLIGEAARTGIQIQSDNVHADARYLHCDCLSETRSEVVIPLKIEDRVLGVLDVQSDHLSAFHPNDILILNALADNIARAVEGARLYLSLRHRADQLALVSEVSRSITATLDLSALMRTAVALIHEKFGFPHVSLFTVHPDRRLIAYQAGSGRRSKELSGFTLSLDDPVGIIPWVARNATTLLANDVSTHPLYVPLPLPPKNTRSELCVPLVYDGLAVGLLDIQSDSKNAFTAGDQQMFEAVADTMAAAVRNADLYRSEQWRRHVADGLCQVAGLISDNVGVDDVLESILSELDHSLPVDISAIWLIQNDQLRLSAVHGIPAESLEATCTLNPDAVHAMAQALKSELPLIRRPQDPFFPSGLAAGYAQNYSSIIAPLRVGERLLGVMTLAHRTAGRYGHESQSIMSTFASYASVAIENARLYDTAQEQAYASAALLQVAQAVVSLGNLDEILGSITRIMPILVGVERVAIYRWDPGRDSFVASHAYGFFQEGEFTQLARELKQGDLPLLDSASGKNQALAVIHDPGIGLKSLLGSHFQLDDSGLLDAFDSLIIAVPISIQSNCFGVMLLQESSNGRRFRSRRLEIIHGIAQQAALAIQNDLLQQEMVVRERLETEAQLARQIQQTFIPQILPTHAHWQFAARWRTARQIGGDFYDVISLANGRLGLFIADVADKGMPAALFMALTHTLLRAAALELPFPADVLRRVNDRLLPDTRQGMFVTAVYGVLDPATGEFSYANAGHTPPIWLRSALNQAPQIQQVEKLTRTTVALGVIEQPAITQRTIFISPGDLLLLYTDGLTEAFSPSGEMFGHQRLIDVLSSMPPCPLEDVLDKVESHLNEFIESEPLGDDLAMLALRRL